MDYPEPSKMELEALSRYTSPVNPAIFPHVTVVLLAVDIVVNVVVNVEERCSSPWFFVYKVTSTKYTWDIYKELISLEASLFIGFRVLCLLLWVSVYV